MDALTLRYQPRHRLDVGRHRADAPPGALSASLSAFWRNPGTSPHGHRGRPSDRHFTIFVIVGMLLAITLTPTPAWGAPAAHPMPQKHTDLGVHTVIIEAPAKAWGIRKTAAVVDRNLEGIDIWAKRGITCMPTVTCIRVTVHDWGEWPDQTCTGRVPESWVGCAALGGPDPYVWLNSSWKVGRKTKRSIGCHELLHALGLDHHSEPGCLGTGRATVPSAVEIETLRGLYG